MPEARLYLFSSPYFEVDGQTIKLELRKSLALLAFMAVQRENFRRDFLINLLWPEEDSSHGRSLLRHVLSPLKNALPEGWLAADRDTVGLQPDISLWVDVLNFRQFVIRCGDHGHLQNEVCPTCQPLLAQAVELYQGDFMAGFTLPDSVNFDEWQYFQSESLRQIFDGALMKLVQCLILSNNLDQAIQPARRRLVLDPLNEDAHCQLMQLYAWTHQRNLALRQFREFKAVLSDQLGVDPQKATQDLMLAIDTGQIPDRPTHLAWQTSHMPDQPGSIQDRHVSFSHPPKLNLPTHLTSFVGRANEIEEVRALVQDHRLVTLTGSGGVGKTRLALRVAEELLEYFPDGVHLAELASLEDPIMIPQTVIAALGQIEQPDRTPIAFLTDFLRPKQLLLILDNVEHLLEACTKLIDDLLRSSPRLTIIVTSREILGLAGETPYRVPPLAMPDPQRLPPLDDLPHFDAVQLFVVRAEVALYGFALTEENAAEVVQITRRLDGIPLAIELAAARLRLMNVGQIARHLNDVYRLLTGGSRTAPPRQKTLQALIDWSYNLLSEEERRLLRNLSVFVGGWTLEAVEEVCEGSGEILDLLGQLVDKSLILATPNPGGEMRYSMLEIVRQFAASRLVEAGETEYMRQRHMAYYLRLCESVEPKLRGREQIRMLDKLGRELDNLRLALGWAMQKNVEAGLRLAGALQWFWYIRFHWSEGIAWLEQGLDAEALTRGGLPLTGTRAMICAKALAALGLFRLARDTSSTHESAKVALTQAIEIYRANHLAHQRGLAWTLVWLGNCLYGEGDPTQAQVLGEEALRLFRETGDLHGTAESLQLLGMGVIDPLEEKKFYEEQLAIEQANGDIDGIAAALYRVGTINFKNGDFEIGNTALEVSRDYYRQAGNLFMVALQSQFLTISSHYAGNLDRAALYLEEAWLNSVEIANDYMIIACLGWKMIIAFTRGDYDQVAEIIAESERIEKNTGIPGLFHDVHFHRARLARLRGEPEAARRHAEEGLNVGAELGIGKVNLLIELSYLALQDGDLKRAAALCREALQVLLEGRDMSLFLWVLDGLAVLAVQEDKLERAARLYGTKMWRGFAHTLSPVEKAQRDADQMELKIALGDERFAKLLREGSMMTFMQILSLVQEEV